MLYPDQADLVARVRQAMRRRKWILMQSATGSGKTRMAADMIAGSRAKGTRAIFTVPRKELLDQTIKTMREYDMPFGVISPDHPPNPFAKLQLAMTPTLARRMDKTTAPDVIFVDEAHYGGAELARVIEWAKASGAWGVGMSATPYKTNGQGMGEWYDHMEEGLPVAELIRLKRLSDFRYFAPSAPDLSGVKSRDGDFVQSQLQSMMEQDAAIVGDAVKTYREKASGLLNVVFCTSRKHAGIVVDAFRAAGVSAMSIDGTMQSDERRRIIRGFARREFTVLCNVQLLTFGFDLAAAADMDVTVECMSDLSPTKSLPLQMQKWGRVLRSKPTAAIILDHAGNVGRHGFPDSPREWSLQGSDKRESGGDRAIPSRQCAIADGGCGFVHPPAPSCPNCGKVYPVQSRMVDEVDGELGELDRSVAAPAFRTMQGMSKTLDDLIRVGRSKGMKHPEAWAAKVISARMAKERKRA